MRRILPAVVFCLCYCVVIADDEIDFNRDVRPILSNKCLLCHGPDPEGVQAGLRFDIRSAAVAELESGDFAIVAGKPDLSGLIARITSDDDDIRMPPADHGARLNSAEIETLRAWILQGAKYATHWSYAKPERPVVPAVPDAVASWPKNAIDHFILRKLLSQGLTPSVVADRYAVARRVFLDLTGLPPTVEEVDRFVGSTEPDAYETMVDELLQRPTFGEHWARKWLDLARYADSAGYADDPPRTIWAYRDWVITAINNNMPFDQFTVEQLAGDLLSDPSDSQLVATAFHRNTLTNNEGGTQDEEFRNVAVVDRVNTTMAVWMGTTMACAQCHTHKYDPITQEEYFRFFAIFNNTQDADIKDESPLLQIYTDEQKEERRVLKKRIAELTTATANGATVSEAQTADLKAAQKQLAELKATTSVPVLREIVEDRRDTHLQHRGSYLDKGQPVDAGLPSAFYQDRTDAPVDRLYLAKWLTGADNPLTARVLVNRFWESIFGRGIVVTSEEFGSQGEPPSHPELLDWLAVELIQNGWDTKHLVRTLVTSATYRQSVQVAANRLEADPDNRWLSRGARVRLSAEMVRDQALHAAGLISAKMYGPPVKPPQPNMGLRAAFGSVTDWKTSEGEDRYRRAIYTTWRRSSPYPSMATFDAPNREVCTVRRNSTNTPLQSLVTLNDPVYVEAAQSLARIALKHEGNLIEQLTVAFRRCLLRPPTDNEVGALTKLFHDSRTKLEGTEDEAVLLATDPLGPLPDGLAPVDAAAMTVVCNVLLNLDEMFLKR